MYAAISVYICTWLLSVIQYRLNPDTWHCGAVWLATDRAGARNATQVARQESLSAPHANYDKGKLQTLIIILCNS